MAKNMIFSISYNISRLVSDFYLNDTEERKKMVIFLHPESGEEVYLTQQNNCLYLANATRRIVCAYTDSEMVFVPDRSMFPIQTLLGNSCRQGNQILGITMSDNDNKFVISYCQTINIQECTPILFNPCYVVSIGEEQIVIREEKTYKNEILNLCIQTEKGMSYQVDGIQLDESGATSIPCIKEWDLGGKIRVGMTYSFYLDEFTTIGKKGCIAIDEHRV